MSRSVPSLPVVALAVAVLLASLSLVAWRQGRARGVLAELDRVRREAALSRAEKADLLHRIQYLESRSRVVPAARARLDMHTPEADEIVILPVDDSS